MLTLAIDRTVEVVEPQSRLQHRCRTPFGKSRSWLSQRSEFVPVRSPLPVLYQLVAMRDHIQSLALRLKYEATVGKSCGTRWTLAAGEFRHLHYASVERCPTVQFDSTSNIGKTPILIPPNVSLTPIHTSLAVKGPLGSTSVGVHSTRPLGWRRIQGSSRGRPERNDRWWKWTANQHETRTFAQHLRAYSIPHQGRSTVSH